MSTRADVEFWQNEKLVARLFVVQDGYKENIIPVLDSALEKLKTNDAQALAAIVVSLDSTEHARRQILNKHKYDSGPRIVPAIEMCKWADYTYRVLVSDNAPVDYVCTDSSGENVPLH